MEKKASKIQDILSSGLNSSVSPMPAVGLLSSQLEGGVDPCSPDLQEDSNVT
jgi:hypothetical protein